MRWTRLSLLLPIFLSIAAAPQPQPQPAGAPESPKDVFDPDRAHVINLKMSGEAWDMIQPAGAGKRAVAGATREQARAAGVRARPSGVGDAYVPGEVEFDGRRS